MNVRNIGLLSAVAIAAVVIIFIVIVIGMNSPERHQTRFLPGSTKIWQEHDSICEGIPLGIPRCNCVY